jgi:hypothetical protein
MGAVIPLLILNYGTTRIGARPSFVLAGLIPAAYILFDVLFLTKRFNAITTIIGVTAITQGGLAFLTVSGWKYALQDTAGTIVTFLLFGVTLFVGKPMVQYFVLQVLEPQSPDEEALASRMLSDRGLHRIMIVGTLIILAENFLRGIANFLLAWKMVTAPFGTPEFNAQKASLESITRWLFMISNMGAMVGAIMLVHSAIEKWIGDAANDGGTLFNQIRKRLGLPTVADNKTT